MHADEVMGLVERYLTANRLEAHREKAVLESAIRSLIAENERLAGELAEYKAGVKDGWLIEGRFEYKCQFCKVTQSGESLNRLRKGSIFPHTPNCIVRKLDLPPSAT